MQTFFHNGVTLHVQTEGPVDAPAIVFSNSLGTDLRVWDALLPHLPPGLRIVRYDKRGHGLSDLPNDAWSMEDNVADLAAIMDELGVKDAVIVGLSVGGLIAQGLAAQRPDLTRALVLMDTAAKIGNDEMWNGRISAIEADGLESIAEGILERWFTAPFRSEDPAFPMWSNMLVRTPSAGYVGTAKAIRDADYTAQTKDLALPVLAIAGAEDGATPPDLVRGTADLIAGARFELIEDAGHLPCVEQPELTAALITAFMGEFAHV